MRIRQTQSASICQLLFTRGSSSHFKLQMREQKQKWRPPIHQLIVRPLRAVEAPPPLLELFLPQPVSNQKQPNHLVIINLSKHLLSFQILLRNPGRNMILRDKILWSCMSSIRRHLSLIPPQEQREQWKVYLAAMINKNDIISAEWVFFRQQLTPHSTEAILIMSEWVGSFTNQKVNSS